MNNLEKSRCVRLFTILLVFGERKDYIMLTLINIKSELPRLYALKRYLDADHIKCIVSPAQSTIYIEVPSVSEEEARKILGMDADEM